MPTARIAQRISSFVFTLFGLTMLIDTLRGVEPVTTAREVDLAVSLGFLLIGALLFRVSRVG